jgi:F-type H+-transporting ATPase subunit b
MAILQQLGINGSVFYTFAIFALTIFFMRYVAFVSYVKAHEERHKRTAGGDQEAKELHKKAFDLKLRYEEATRDISAEVRSIFDVENKKAQSEYDQAVSRARIEADRLIEETRLKIQADIQKASNELKAEAPVIGMIIAKKMLI